ncbi:MAG: ORF6N domain-containing protein [Bacteroidetes bacterium]|nr:ORF6N domain-containing protein [Bacteroidota bacterium]
MLDFHLAELYDVQTKRLKERVKRNIDRFPEDFMFELTGDEFSLLRSQFATTNRRGGIRYKPFVFTEQGVAMLATVLNSDRAIQMNIAIMRAFVKLRELIASNKELAGKLAELEKKYDAQFKVVFDAIRQLMALPEKPKREIGFRIKESSAKYGVKRKRC